MTQVYKKKSAVPKEKRICRYCHHADRDTPLPNLTQGMDYVYCRHVKQVGKTRPLFHETDTCKKFGAAWKVDNKILADRLRGGARSAR